MVRVIDVLSDQPSGDAADEDVGGEVLFGEDTADADRSCQAVDRCLRQPARILRCEDRGHRPREGGVVRGERSVIPGRAEELTVRVIGPRAVPAEDDLQRLVDGESVDGCFAGEEAGLVRLRSVVEEAPEVGGGGDSADTDKSTAGEGVGFVLSVGVQVDRLRHGVMIASDQHSGGDSKGDEPDSVAGLEAERAGPDGLLVVEESFRSSGEGDVLGLLVA